MNSYRPTVYGMRHAVSAGHYLATMAGFSVLEAGGNAVDAGCAAGIALGVLQPDLVNVAGVAPIIIRMADGTVETIAGLGHWPAALPPDVFMREHGGEIPVGVRRTVVPAAPDAWITALERHGTMGFGEVAVHAIRFASEGFAVNELLAASISSHVAEYASWPENAAIFLPGGAPPPVGAKFVQADLGRTLQYMADQERAASAGGRAAGLAAARHAFYRGDIAHAIAAHQKAEGGFLSLADLAGFRSRIEPAVQRRWRGHEVMTCGPWCQGPALLQALLLVEQVGIDGLGHNSPEYLHVIAECLKLALADREYHFGDPALWTCRSMTCCPPARWPGGRRRSAVTGRVRACRRHWPGGTGRACSRPRPRRSRGWRRTRPTCAPWIGGGTRSRPRRPTGRPRRRLCRAWALSHRPAGRKAGRTRRTHLASPPASGRG